MNGHSASAHWVRERVISVLCLPLSLWLVWSVARMPGWSYQEFTGWLAMPVNACLMAASVILIFYHSLMGLEVVVDDYVPHAGINRIVLLALRIFFAMAGMGCLLSIVKISMVAT